MRIAAIIFALLTATFSTQAQARHHYHHNKVAITKATGCVFDNNGHRTCQTTFERASEVPGASHFISFSNDPRPRAWCGWWMRHELGVADRAYNLARHWAEYGSSAHGPAVGTIVVWPHHVGLVTGRTESGWIVKSGNDGREVRERERSLRGAIAFRWPVRMAGI